MIGGRRLVTRQSPEAVGGGGVIGELPERLLEPLEGVVAAGSHPRGEHGGKDLQGVPEFLALDPQRMNLVGVAELPVGHGKEPTHQRPEPPAGVRLKGQPAALGRHIGQEFFDPFEPVAFQQPLVLHPNGLSRHLPLFRKHRHEPPAGESARGDRVLRQPVGEHVEVPGFAGRPADALQLLGEPGHLLFREQVVERIDRGDGPTGRDAQAMHALRVAGPTGACGRQLLPDRIESFAECPGRDHPGRTPAVFGHDPRTRKLHRREVRSPRPLPSPVL